MPLSPEPQTPSNPADRYFASGGAQLRYRDEGSGPAVLFLHGWTFDLEMWEPQVAALHGAFRVIRFDRRGFGLSTGRPGLEADVTDIDALCRHLALSRIALVGMSQGARAALTFAQRRPELLSCVVLDGPPDPSTANAESDVPIERYRAIARSDGIAAVRREWAQHPLVRTRTEDAQNIVMDMIARYPGADLGPAAAPPVAVETLGDPRSIVTACLIIVGKQDLPTRLRAADELARQIAGAERVLISAAGHLANLDNPPTYNTVLRAFLDRHAASMP